MTVGDPVILHCQATGFPQPMVTWQKDGQPVDTSHVALLSNDSLHISSTSVQDAGKFSCIASNIAGSATVTADIVIYGWYLIQILIYLVSAQAGNVDIYNPSPRV